jgi:PGF-pre-PGF domain-containing protein
MVIFLKNLKEISKLFCLCIIFLTIFSTVGSALQANITSDKTNGTAPLIVNFEGYGNDTVQDWYWDFGDGGNSTEQNPSHVFNNPGTYNVTLTAPNGPGSPSTFFSTINVYPAPVIADFAMNKVAGVAPLAIQFTDLSIGDIVLWRWDFGDGSSSNVRNPTHTYFLPGTYAVRLTVSNAIGVNLVYSDDFGAQLLGDVRNISAKKSLVFASETPVAYFYADFSEGQAPLTVQFFDGSTGYLNSWFWDFGDGSTSRTRNPRHTFYSPGTYNVRLTVKDAFGNGIYSGSKLIDVYDVPIADFSSNISGGHPPLTVQFTDNSTGNPTSWSWAFGDGSASNEINPVHTYYYPGNYKVTLLVSNRQGTSFNSWCNYNYTCGLLSTLKTSIIDVKTANLTADFTWREINGTTTVYFYDISSDSPIAWKWDFNSDGYVDSIDKNPIYQFQNSGIHNVSLSVFDGLEWRNMNKTIYIAGGAENNTSGSGSSSGDSSGGSSGGSSGSSHSSGSTSVSSGGSSSGGGGGGSPEPQRNVGAKELSQIFISKGNLAKFEFPQKATPVVYICFDSKKTVGKTTTIAEMLKGKSILTSDIPNSEVYKYLNIWVGNSGYATKKNIENAIVCFKVEKSWVKDKNIDKSSITLNWYSDDKEWNALPTNLSSEDEKYLCFTAKTPEFSYFAITGKPIVNETGKQPAAVNKMSDTQNVDTNSPEEKDKSSSSTESSMSMPGFEVVSSIMGLLAVLLYRRGK